MEFIINLKFKSKILRSIELTYRLLAPSLNSTPMWCICKLNYIFSVDLNALFLKILTYNFFYKKTCLIM